TLHRAAASDVQGRSGQAQDRAVGVEFHRAATRPNPDPVAAGGRRAVGADAVFGLELGGFAGDVAVHGVDHGGQVLRMDHRRGIGLLRTEVVAAPTVVPGDQVAQAGGWNVEIPVALAA